jgi:type VI secretion system protein ImpG
MKRSGDEYLNYFEKELSYLRTRGIEFARKYPKVAGRLDLGIDESPDPHIERLIESFAFLTARIQSNIDSEFPQLSTAILGNIYPQLLNPIPSMSVARFSAGKGKLPAVPLKIGKDHPLVAYTSDGQKCRFKTCYPVDLFPLEVSTAQYTGTGDYPFLEEPRPLPVLHLRVEATDEIPVNKMKPGMLRFYLHGESWLTNSIYEILFCNTKYVKVYPDNIGRPGIETRSFTTKISPVGFIEDESVLPYPKNANAGYGLLQEYFAFPEKFRFFDINNINVQQAEKYIDLYIVFDRQTNYEFRPDKSNFLLGCTPIINLFQKLSEPIRIDQLRSEYRINPDSQREPITEIHSIISVYSASKTEDPQNIIEPYFSYKNQKRNLPNKVYWHSRRQKTTRPEIPGSDLYLLLVDLNFNQQLPSQKTLYASIICTNRNLAPSFSQGTWLNSEMKLADLDISMLKTPTNQIDAPDSKELWRLISALSLNYLSLSSSSDGLHAFKEILHLYDFEKKADTQHQIDGIASLDTKNIVRRFGPDNWRGFSRGIEVSLELDEDYFAGNNAFLFASVLNRFFPLYATVNSFTQLKIFKKRNKEEVWKTWHPRIGQKEII